MKDWTGNKRSVFATLGASNHSDYERAENDYYATSPIAIDKLASKFEIPSRIWEPACGEGHLSKRLIELGHDVFSTDLINRGYGTQLDFLSLESYNYKDQFPCILTNPPYKYVTEFILRTMELLPEDGYGIFLLKTTALESKKRYEKIYKHTPPYTCSSSSSDYNAQETEISRRCNKQEGVQPLTHGLFFVKETHRQHKSIGYEA